MMSHASGHQFKCLQRTAKSAPAANRRAQSLCAQASLASSHPRRAFSLIEVLLAIFILGIGVISVAALFPAGIVQQRQSADDSIGPMVASAAMDVIRSKLKATDFGTFEDFFDTSGFRLNPPWSQTAPIGPTAITVRGDWPWLRPALLIENDTDPDTFTFPPNGSQQDRRDEGSIDIFGWYPAYRTGVTTLREFDANLSEPAYPLFSMPYNKSKYTGGAPRVIITQQERYYPQVGNTFINSTETAQPQYLWDCAFRRFEGKILVAIFVYRATSPGSGGPVPFVSTALPTGSNSARPPIPYRLDLWDFGSQGAINTVACEDGPWHGGGMDRDLLTPLDNNRIAGTAGGTTYDPVTNPEQAWQEPRQWILDQNNSIHRVVGQYRASVGDPMEVELSRPVARPLGFNDTTPPSMAPTGTPYLYVGQPLAPSGFVLNNIVTHLWYIPQEMDIDANYDGTPETRVVLTPVYVTVKEL